MTASGNRLYRDTGSFPTNAANYTFAGWFKYLGTGDGTWEAVASVNDGSGSSYHILYAMDNLGPRFSIYGSAGNIDFGAITTGQWYYCGFYRATGNITGFFCLPTATALTTGSASAVSFTPAEASLNWTIIWTSEWTNGVWANWMMWSTVLTADQLLLQRHFSRPVTAIDSLMGWWPLPGVGDYSEYAGLTTAFSNTGSTKATVLGPPIIAPAPIYIPFISTGNDQISGTAAGTGSASGTLTGSGALSGTAAGTSTPTGTLLGLAPISGQADGVASPTGTLSGWGTLAGQADGTSTPTGTLLGTGTLTGSIPGTSLPTGTLTGTGALAGTGAGVGAASGTLTSVGIVLSAEQITDYIHLSWVEP